MKEMSLIAEMLGGSKALGPKILSWKDLAAKIRKGLPYASLEFLMRALVLSREETTTSLALSERTIARRKKEKKLRPDESDRLFRVARIAARVIEVFGTYEMAARWLHKRNRALGNRSPLSEIDTDIGARSVEQVLGRIEHGIFS